MGGNLLIIFIFKMEMLPNYYTSMIIIEMFTTLFVCYCNLNLGYVYITFNTLRWLLPYLKSRSVFLSISIKCLSLIQIID